MGTTSGNIGLSSTCLFVNEDNTDIDIYKKYMYMYICIYIYIFSRRCSTRQLMLACVLAGLLADSLARRCGSLHAFLLVVKCLLACLLVCFSFCVKKGISCQHSR